MSRRCWILIGSAMLLGLIPEAMIAQRQLANGLPDALFERDFCQFWAAGWLVDHGQIGTLFHPARFQAWMVQRFPFLTGHYRWGYPPSMALLMAPLGILSPLAAWVVAMAGGIALLVMALGVVFGWRKLGLIALILLASPICWDTLLVGQNAFYTGALMALGFGLLDRRPLLAGIAFGLLAVKPPLALLAPVAMLAAGAWRGMIAATLTSLALAALAALVMPHAWPWFITHTMPEMTAYLQRPYLPTPSQAYMASPFYAAEGLRLPRRAAWLIQVTLSILAAAAMARLWRVRLEDQSGRHARMLSSAALCLVATPYSHVYDATGATALLCTMLVKHDGRMSVWLLAMALVALAQPGWSLTLAIAFPVPVFAWLAWLAIGCAGLPAVSLTNRLVWFRLKPVRAGAGGLHIEREAVRQRRESA
jgi:hypothetical protein